MAIISLSPSTWRAVVLLSCLISVSSTVAPLPSISRDDFKEDFAWGSATSAYQVEGAVNEGGRGPSIWDEIVLIPGVIRNGDDADVAVDQYHRFEEDIDLMVWLGMTHYRFSIAWPRIFPDGEGAINAEGIAYYNRLIDALLRKGIQPVATLFHWDLPLSLHRKYGGWLNEAIAPLFGKYAEACFNAFGDRIKLWITFNEPRIEYQREFLTGCYQACLPAAEKDCSRVPAGLPCDCTLCKEWLQDGLFNWVPYQTTHVILLSHAAAAEVYHKKYRATQGGKVGITLDCEWPEPRSNSSADREASNRYILFNLGWFLYPLLKGGDYPPVMREYVGSRLPQFTAEQQSVFQSTPLDFLGLNHYTSRYARAVPRQPASAQSNYYSDICCQFSERGPDGNLIGPLAGSDWLYVYAPGMRKLLLWIHGEFPDFPIYVTENGFSDREFAQPKDSYLNDIHRVSYYATYAANVAYAMQ
eukprot:TRINITY_DN621_c0_g1_i4.p1 TRINITY_DN621_c0_g1~~TRINITY_DN621_c0_g1_i4.p1  ORF type:complete len:471 (+),score=48.67 TRINITY_DN621_c0_g1_i4:72-1484(+)